MINKIKITLNSVSVLFLFVILLLKWGINYNFGSLFFILGWFLGILFLDLDYFLYVFFTRPDDELSLQAKAIFNQKKYKETIFFVLNHSEENKELVLHSALFAPVIFFLTIFVVTSSNSFFGSGLVLGLFLRYIFDTVFLYKRNREFFRARLFWNIRIDDFNFEKFFIITLVILLFLSSALFIR